jgi:hypothetical protein
VVLDGGGGAVPAIARIKSAKRHEEATRNDKRAAGRDRHTRIGEENRQADRRRDHKKLRRESAARSAKLSRRCRHPVSSVT